ncbi:hypothetical protein [Actomonas aquatica]|uniref:Uncharacterized protein n=1 Tax=Actomonas aquatica TaxID=2866162 RepID=A0ABZ1CEV8_9BACT|nr:hypothetical protein [Opitutus sp. WL0086]WRQ90033.1 hypothetical protein K1X11_011495 [Opitutus sp. WL0086]
MSDEPEPPALRLRPRKKPAADSAPADTAKPDPSPAAKADETTESPKLKLRPQSTGEATPANPAAPANPEAPVAKERAKPRLSLKLDKDESAAPASAEEPKTSLPPTEPKSGAKPRLSLKTDSAEEPTPETADEAALPPVSDSLPPVDLPRVKPEKPKLKLSWANKPAETPADDAPPPLPPSPTPPPSPSAKPPSAPPMILPDVTPIESNLDGASSTMPPFLMTDGAASNPPVPPPPAFAPAGDAGPDYPPPPPSMAGDGASASPSFPPPPAMAGGANTAAEMATEEAPARKRLDQSLAFKGGVILVMVLVLAGLGYGGWMGYQMFFGAEEPAPVASTPAPTPTPAPTQTVATPPAEGPRSTAGQLIDRARQAAGTHDELTAALDDATAGQPTADLPVENAAAARPRVTIADTPVAAAPEAVQPSPEFLTWVSEARVSGVREGDSPRAFINGILVRRGDTIDVPLGIVFDGVDARRNLLIFKDDSGAVVGKKY